MTSAQAPVPIEALLAHRGWVRRLARSLVRDDATADDVEQRTWLAALRSPPVCAESARAWLARVVRSQASKTFRADGRRGAHESAAARPESRASPQEIVAQAEVHRRLVGAVLRLCEPYRTTVLLRFFDDAPPRVVAERMGVPVETVRTRLRRALDLLREHIAGDGGGEGWIRALAPLVAVRGEPGAALGAAGLQGGTIMAGKATVAAAVGLAVVAGYAGGTLSGAPAASSRGPDLERIAQRLDALESPRTREAGTANSRDAERRIAALDERHADEERRIQALETRLAAAERAAAASAEPDPSVELARLQGLGTPELIAEIRQLASDLRGAQRTRRPKGPAPRREADAVTRACDVALGRSLDAEQRAETLVEKGTARFALDDPTGAEPAFRQALDAVGYASTSGIRAAGNLHWFEVQRKNLHAAADLYLGIAKCPGLGPMQRASYLHAAGDDLVAAGETGRARETFRAVIDTYANDEDAGARGYAERARKSIEKLDANAR